MFGFIILILIAVWISRMLFRPFRGPRRWFGPGMWMGGPRMRGPMDRPPMGGPHGPGGFGGFGGPGPHGPGRF